MDLPKLSQIKALRVVDLKQRLAEFGLPQSGLKGDLVARLDAHYNSLRNQAEVGSAPGAPQAAGHPYQHQPVDAGQHQQVYLQQRGDNHLLAEQQRQQEELQRQQQIYLPPEEQEQLMLQQQNQQRQEAEMIRLREEEMLRQQQQIQMEEARQQEEQRIRQQFLVMQHQQQEALRAQEQQAQEALQQQQQQQAAEARRLEEEEQLRVQEHQARERQALMLQQQAMELEALRVQKEREAADELRQREELERRYRQEQAEQEQLALAQEAKKKEEERLRIQAEQEQLRIQAEQEQLRLQAVQEQMRQQAEQEQMRQRAEQEQLRQQEIQEQLKQQAEQEQLRKQAEQEQLKEAQERMRQQAEQEQLRQQEIQAQLKQQAEQEQLRQQAEQEQLRIQAEQEELQRKQKEQEEKLKRDQEEERLRQEKQQEEDRLRREREQEEERLRQEQALLLQKQKDLEQELLKQREFEEKQARIKAEQERAVEASQPAQGGSNENNKSNIKQTFSFPKAGDRAPALINPNPVSNFDPHDLEDVHKNEAPAIVTPPEDKKSERNSKNNEKLETSPGGAEENGGKNRRNKKKKKKKKNRPEEWARLAAEAERKKREELEKENEPEVEIEYVQEKLEMDPSDPLYRTFSKIFDNFKIVADDDDKVSKAEELSNKPSEELKKVPKLLEEDDLIEQKDDEDDDKPKLSKRKLKKLNRLSVAELKQLVSRPDVVEMHDVTARDPRLLVHLKSTRNTVPVPRHWCFKRKYLQGKRGIEKPPFNLPDFIKKTGIMEMREALQEKEDSKGLKTKMREKVRPKLGKIDIDYQKLHDAFFKWQTKPKMTLHGDLYYEGKEFEIRLKEKKPGDLTDDLRTALGMPVGPNAHKVPPPWLIAMQRYGPPPSYPNLKIAGLNAPIPDGCSFGYHAGGWGKPPVDESGKPLYGDVFGTSDSAFSQQIPVEEIDTSLWGELESESEEEESEEEEEEEEEEGAEGAAAAAAAQQSGLQTPVVDAGLATPSGLSSVGLGQETPELLELRKKRIEAEMEGGETPNLYTILPEKKSDRVGASMMGSTHTYDIRKPASGAASSTFDSGGVELALNPEEVDLMDTDAMQARAEAAMREQQASLAKEDLSDMVAEHAAKQSSKRKRAAGGKDDRDKGSKRHKEFKF